MKKLLTLFSFGVVTMALFITTQPTTVQAAFVQNNIMDDAVFDDTSTMSAGQIQDFLNGFPSSCIKNLQTPYPQDYFTYGGNVSAATAIRRVADLWGLNPRVILATLEKESSLVTGGAGCDNWRFTSAMGYNCPDSGGRYDYPAIGVYGTCVKKESDAGFIRQVNHGSWQLKFNKERADNNLSWNGDGNLDNYGFMTQGYRSIRLGSPAAYYSGNYAIDGTAVHMDNGTTASLYTYTPHLSGNRNFVTIFERWFNTTRANDTSVPHPNGALISDGQYVYRVENGTRRHIGAAAFNAYGYNWSQVKPASTGDRNLLIPGTPLWVVPTGTVFTANDGKVYVADDRSGTLKKQWMSASTFEKLKYSWSQVIATGSSSDVPPITEPGLLEDTRHPSGTVVKINSEVYVIDRYTLRYVTAVAFASNTFRWDRLIDASADDSSLAKGSSLDLQPGTILYSNGNVYVTDKDSGGIFKRPFGPWECFADRLHYTGNDWLSVPVSALPVRTGGSFSC